MTPKRWRTLVLGLVTAGVIIAGLFGLRTLRTWRELREHRPPPPLASEHIETNVELIRDWMTIPFIAKMYHVRPHILFEAVDIPAQGNREKSLKQLNEEYFPGAQGIVEAKIKAAVLENLPPGTPVIPALPTAP